MQGRGARGFEDDLLRLEKDIPGLGGIYRDPSGALVVFLVDRRQERAAAQVLASRAPDLALDTGLRHDLLMGSIQFRTGQYAFSQLVAWQALTLDALTKVNGLLGVDADESTNRVHLRLAEGTPVEAIQSRLTAAGIPGPAVRITFGPPLVSSTPH